MNSFEKLLEDYAIRYRNGCFIYRSGDTIENVTKRNKCPNEYGVYLIYGIKNESEEVIYIGASGTVQQNRCFCEQGICKRISAPRKNYKSADEYYRKILQNNEYSCLKFKWFVTFDNSNKILPKFAEAELIQCYYNENGCLPKENSKWRLLNNFHLAFKMLA
jgi:hypothetical protein